MSVDCYDKPLSTKTWATWDDDLLQPRRSSLQLVLEVRCLGCAYGLEINTRHRMYPLFSVFITLQYKISTSTVWYKKVRTNQEAKTTKFEEGPDWWPVHWRRYSISLNRGFTTWGEYWITSCRKHSLKLTGSLPLKIRPKQPEGKEMQFIFQSSIFQRLSTSVREGILHQNHQTDAIVCTLSPLQSPKPHQRTHPKPPAHPDTQINEGIGYQGPNTTPGQLVRQTGERCRVGTVEPTKPFEKNMRFVRLKLGMFF